MDNTDDGGYGEKRGRDAVRCNVGANNEVTTVEKRAGRRRRVKHPQVRNALVRALKVDFGYDASAWMEWWRRNESRFRDVDSGS